MIHLPFLQIEREAILDVQHSPHLPSLDGVDGIGEVGEVVLWENVHVSKES